MKLYILLTITSVAFINLPWFASVRPSSVQTDKCTTMESSIDNSKVDSLVRSINEYRSSLNLNLLQPDLNLTKAASYKAYIYSQTREWSHNPNGVNWYDYYDRCKALIGDPTRISENLARGFNAEPALILDSWKKSESHNSVLVDPHLQKIGVFISPQELDFFTVALFSN